MINHSHNSEQRFILPLLVLLNLVPLFGVFNWGWQSFELIFLYWMENAVIGVFTLVRMVARPYGHPLEFAFPLFFAPFFALHYGAFTWGHGTFVVSLFGSEGMSGFALTDAVLHILQSQQMLIVLAALVGLQVLDWLRDTLRYGLGADSITALMTKPYRRIVVLHLTIIGSGFALSALHEPLAGLVLLVILKTAFDLWHWKKDNDGQPKQDFRLSPEKLAELESTYPTPKVTVNGHEIHFDSFSEMKASKEFRLAVALMRLIAARDDLAAINTYMDMRIAREQGSLTTA